MALSTFVRDELSSTSVNFSTSSGSFCSETFCTLSSTMTVETDDGEVLFVTLESEVFVVSVVVSVADGVVVVAADIAGQVSDFCWFLSGVN